MIESWLLVQTVKIALGVFLGAIIFSAIIWKLNDFEEKNRKERMFAMGYNVIDLLQDLFDATVNDDSDAIENAYLALEGIGMSRGTADECLMSGYKYFSRSDDDTEYTENAQDLS